MAPDSSTATLDDGLRSSLAGIPSSDVLECDEITESLCVLRAADGLGGRIGTAGTIGRTGRLFVCVGVSCDFGVGTGALDEGVVGCVEIVSEGVSEV